MCVRFGLEYPRGRWELVEVEPWTVGDGVEPTGRRDNDDDDDDKEEEEEERVEYIQSNNSIANCWDEMR